MMSLAKQILSSRINPLIYFEQIFFNDQSFVTTITIHFIEANYSLHLSNSKAS